MNTIPPLLLPAQEKLLEMFRLQAGSQYVGEKFTFNRPAKGKSKLFLCRNIMFSIEISDEELLALAQKGYLRLYADSLSIIFTEKVFEKTPDSGSDLPFDPGTRDSQMQVVRADIIQLYAWFIASLIASSISLFLVVIVIQQVMNKNLTVGILSTLSTIVSGFVTKFFFKNYDKANERLKRLRSGSLIERK